VTDGATVRSTEIDSYPESRVHNSQPHGIGRVTTLDGLGAWSNLGRNVVFTGDDLRPRAIFDESAFTEDEPSQYDLDVHAVLELPGAGMVVTLNHLGTVRAFRRSDLDHPGPRRRVRPAWSRAFAADVERAVVAGGRLVGSRPREQHAPGVLVSEQLGASTRVDLDHEVQLESWGAVNALAPLPSTAGERVALGGGRRVSVLEVADGRVHSAQWDAALDFEPSTLVWDGSLLWAAGSDEADADDDYHWDALRGGGFAALDPADGRAVVRGHFEVDLAWGRGGVAVAVVPGALCGLGRRGEVFVFDTATGTHVATIPRLADRSLGIAHGAVIGSHLVFGFNRGGYRLHMVPVASIRALVGSGRGRVADAIG
jgi:hypothetical protein